MIKKIFPIILFACMIIAGYPCNLKAAVSAEQEYYSAEVYCSQFMKDSKRLKYRDNWIVCIQKFESAYNKNPSGQLAPASLYMTGKLYHDLYFRSGKASDKKEALDIYNRIVRRFPQSNYSRKAETALEKLSPGSGDSVNTLPVKTPYIKKKTVKTSENRKTYEKREDNLKVKKRASVFRKSKEEYRASLNRNTPVELDRLFRQEETYSPSPAVSAIRYSSGGPTVISGLRVWSNPNYTRVVVDADKETSYTHKLLDRDVSHNKPQRLYIDFANSMLDEDIKKVIPINDDLLRGARAAQRNHSSVRVVIDIKSFKTYKIFSLKNPFRTIIDVWGQDAGSAYVKRYRPAPPPPPAPAPVHKKPRYEASIKKDSKITPHDLAKQLALGVRRIVIDPGHGGRDGGAPGYLRGVKEKDIVLKIAKRLARKIRSELGCEVIMTRNGDRFLSLEERTAIANTKNADLFISIHANASKNRKAYGIETYYLNLATDDDAIRVAARENAISRKNISDLQTILNDLMKNSKINESSRLASHVQKSMHSRLKTHYGYIKNKGVKQAPFYVLIGAQMPSILIETSFISNKRECKRLGNGNYQEHLCNAIIDGIRKYIKETSPTAFLRSRPKKRG